MADCFYCMTGEYKRALHTCSPATDDQLCEQYYILILHNIKLIFFKGNNLDILLAQVHWVGLIIFSHFSENVVICLGHCLR
jgi:hypothetical protein